MVQVVQLTVKQDIAFSEEFLEAKRNRKLSSLTNDLWRAHFNVAKERVPEDMTSIEDELRMVDARKALLLDKRKMVQKKLEEEKTRYMVIE